MNNLEKNKLELLYSVTSNIDEKIDLCEKYRSCLIEMLKKEPQNVSLLIQVGVLSWEPLHESELAIEYLEKSIYLEPTNIDARFWLAKCYYHDFCAYDKATNLLVEALNLNSTRADCLSLFAEIIEFTSRDTARAISYLEKAIIFEPEWPSLRLFLGSLYMDINKSDLAYHQMIKTEELATKPKIVPKNGVESYYENIVTGRAYQKLTEKIDHLKQRIQGSRKN